MDGCAVVLSEFPRELAIGGVDAVDMGCVVVEEAVGEAAGGASEVGADEVFWVEVELFEGVVEFEPASGDIGVGIGFCRFGWKVHLLLVLLEFGCGGGRQGSVGDGDADDGDFEFIGSFDHFDAVEHDDIACGNRQA